MILYIALQWNIQLTNLVHNTKGGKQIKLLPWWSHTWIFSCQVNNIGSFIGFLRLSSNIPQNRFVLREFCTYNSIPCVGVFTIFKRTLSKKLFAGANLQKTGAFVLDNISLYWALARFIVLFLSIVTIHSFRLGLSTSSLLENRSSTPDFILSFVWYVC